MHDLRFGTFNSGRDELVLWDHITLRSEMKRSHKCSSHVIKMSSHIGERIVLKCKTKSKRNEMERNEYSEAKRN